MTVKVETATEDDAWAGGRFIHGTKVLGEDSDPLSRFEVLLLLYYSQA